MDNNGNKHLADVRTSLEGWKDERFLTRSQAYTAYLLNTYSVNLAEEAGIEIRGFSFRVRLPLSLLVVKATSASDPVVCFISARTFLNAFKIFFARLEEGTVEWRHDQYG